MHGDTDFALDEIGLLVGAHLVVLAEADRALTDELLDSIPERVLLCRWHLQAFRECLDRLGFVARLIDEIQNAVEPGSVHEYMICEVGKEGQAILHDAADEWRGSCRINIALSLKQGKIIVYGIYFKVRHSHAAFHSHQERADDDSWSGARVIAHDARRSTGIHRPGGSRYYPRSTQRQIA